VTEYAPPPADEKDWTWVVRETCPECGFDASTVGPDRIADEVLRLTAPWASVLEREDVTVRPAPQTWSPLEYGCHVRDVCRVFDGRTHLMLDVDEPTFANWDQDGAAVEGRYHEQDPAQVAVDLADAAATWAATYRTVGADQWDRAGLRSNGSDLSKGDDPLGPPRRTQPHFTVTTLGRYGLHDLAHHLVDVGERWN